MNRYLTFQILMIIFCLVFSLSGFAQSESYLETIYQADSQGLSAVPDEDQINYVENQQEPEIVNASEPTGIPAQQKALDRLQNIINRILQILIGKMGGAKIVVVVIPRDKIIPKTPPQRPPTDTSPSETKGNSTSNSASSTSNSSKNTSETTETSTDTSTSVSAERSTSTGTSSSSSSTGASNSGGSSGSSGSSTATSTSANADTQKPDDIAGMRAYIKQKYNIDCLDGDRGTWSINQLKAAEEAFASLPSFFRDATQKVLRDGPPPSFAPRSALGYVMVPERTVHLLDLSTKMTQGMYNSLVAAYGRPPTVEEQLQALKRNFQGTLVHEMTHCFQNTYPQIYRAWRNTFNCASSPTNYGKTQPAEDMAESVRIYWQGGSIRNGKFISNTGAVMDLERYEFIKKYIMKGKEYLN